MEEVKVEVLSDIIKIYFSGRIDSNNAKDVETQIQEAIGNNTTEHLVIDTAKLEYISSAGLRIFLRLKKEHDDLTVINVNSEIYEIFDMTGFTQIMNVEKAYRVISVEGCEEIGRGANGKVYRIDHDNVVKVYNNPDSLDEIKNEREVARKALVLGIPTAISYDIVKVGNSYGSVFELLDAKPFSKILDTEPDKMDWCVEEYVNLLKKIHSTEVPEGELPDIRESAKSWVDFVKGYIPDDAWTKIDSMLSEVPYDPHMLHGDFHTKNIEYVGGEVLIIDMDTLSVGYPIFELAAMFNAFIGYNEYDHAGLKPFLGIDYDTSVTFWNKFLGAYIGTTSQKKIDEVCDKARVIGYVRMIRRRIRQGDYEEGVGKAEIELWTKHLLEVLGRVDSLLFDLNEKEFEAVKENLPAVNEFVEHHLDLVDCPMKAKMQISVAVEEIFVNIANYAYSPNKGNATVRVEVSDEPIMVSITFMDKGVPYDPLAKEDPDVSMSAEERQIGGLGIFMVKKSMDDISYEYKDGKNILTLKKKLD